MSTQPTDEEARLFVVDDDHPGTTEDVWLNNERIGQIRPFLLPPVPRVVVVAAHPDDEVLGAGGLLQILARSGRTLELCSVTDGEASHPTMGEALREIRVEECAEALIRLGVTDITHTRLQIPDGAVGEHEEELASVLAARLGPGSLCVAPWQQDGHPDHEACGRAARLAAEAVGAISIEFPIWAWHWTTPASPLPWERFRRLDLAPALTARKQHAIDAFASQLQPFGPGARSAILPPPTVVRFHRPFEIFVV